MLLAKIARSVITKGRLTLIDARGRAHVIEGEDPGPAAAVRFHDARAQRRVLINPQLALGEAYMDGALDPVDCDIADVLRLLTMNVANLQHSRWHALVDRWRFLTRRIAQHNPVSRSKANVAHHYDLSGEVYDLFLDRERFYSCAYFPDGVDDLDTAQTAKARHLAAKLQIAPGLRALDIGSGWGGMAIHLARLGAGRVDGVTLSEEQLAWSRRRAQEEGLEDRVDFRLQDYRALEGPYDRIVSVGMFEHVGVGHYGEYFGAVRDLLAEDGVAVIHSIGRSGPPGFTNPWLAKYIFPGGYIPALSEVLPVVERAGLIVTDIEILRLHYAETLKAWRERFHARWDEAAAIYDERFRLMFDFYLAGSEMSFREGGMMVFQLQLAKDHAAVPLTRDYVGDFEAAHPVEPQTAHAAE